MWLVFDMAFLCFLNGWKNPFQYFIISMSIHFPMFLMGVSAGSVCSCEICQWAQIIMMRTKWEYSNISNCISTLDLRIFGTLYVVPHSIWKQKYSKLTHFSFTFAFTFALHHHAQFNGWVFWISFRNCWI